MAEVPTINLAKFARDVLTEWQQLVDETGLTLNRQGMRTCLNLEICMLNLISLVEQAEKQETSNEEFTAFESS